ncbi:MAG: glutaredoxin family protein, partial [Gaiella sp.]
MTHAVTLYTATGCSLCEDALKVLDDVRADVPFELEVVNIAGDPDLEAAHRESLPVVVIDGGPTFRLFLEADA